jgi:tRNA threonylcarbamoyladenosine biosynthesis protein TsaE
MISLTFESNSEADTERFGRRLAQVLPAGSVVALTGTLGAGKTRLVQAIAAGLGVPRDAVISPTFVLIHEYRQGRLPIFHFDVYRLRDADEFGELGPEEYFDGHGVCLIEWADRIEEYLPAKHLRIEIEVTGTDTRRITVAAMCPDASALVDQISVSLANG